MHTFIFRTATYPLEKIICFLNNRALISFYSFSSCKPNHVGKYLDCNPPQFKRLRKKFSTLFSAILSRCLLKSPVVLTAVSLTTGISGIANLTEMSLVINYSLHRMNPNVRLSKRNQGLLIAGAWAYGMVCMFPPLLGWNRFVPGAARISCGPDWTDNSASGMSYNLVLVVLGFFLPLSVMCMAYYKIYR